MILNSKENVTKLLGLLSTPAQNVTQISIQFSKPCFIATVLWRLLVQIGKYEVWYWSRRQLFICITTHILELGKASGFYGQKDTTRYLFQ